MKCGQLGKSYSRNCSVSPEFNQFVSRVPYSARHEDPKVEMEFYHLCRS